ncbi:MAG: 5'-flap endonuclease [Icmadophila ericetorum]|nr:5'-flap endonuclease [Icmadophila ericetorum]
MATSAIVILSSSPLPSMTTPRRDRHSPYCTPISSSPRPPLVGELLGRPSVDHEATVRPQIVPYEGESSPITPWTLPRSGQPVSREYEVPESRSASPVPVPLEEPEQPEMPKKAQRRKNAGKESSDGATKKLKAPRKKAESATVGDGVSNGGSEKSKTKGLLSTKKPRMAKSKDDGQTKIKSGKISKPKTSVASRGATKTANVLTREGPRIANDKPLGLEKAMARKREWTPIEEASNNPIEATYVSSASGPDVGNDSVLMENPRKVSHSALIRSFSYSEPEQEVRVDSTVYRSIEGEAAIKKRKIELIRPLNSTLVPYAKGAREKSQKKKYRTITEKATESFIPENENSINSLLQYFDSSPVDARPAIGLIEQKEEAKRPELTRRKSLTTSAATKATATGTKLRKKAVKAPALLSPEEALKAWTNQDILFGTTSQLACEESPTFTRELQEAIRASESIEQPDLTKDARNLTAESTINTPKLSTVSLIRSSKSLWSVAARDGDGALLNAEVIDLSITPKAQVQLNGKPFAIVPDLPIIDPELRQDDRFRSILDEQDTPRPLKVNKEPPAERPQVGDVVTTLQAIPRSLAEATLRERPRNHSLPTEQPVVVPSISTKPTFEGYSTDKLAKAIKNYGFKPVKNRDTMIKLLDQCWEGKARLALQSLLTNVSPTKKDALAPTMTETSGKAKPKGRPKKVLDADRNIVVAEKPPPKPRGRPKKNSLTSSTATTTLADELGDPDPDPKVSKTVLSAKKATTTKEKAKSAPVVDDISDPEPLPTPSPPRRRHRSQTALPLSSPTCSPHLSAANPTSSQAHLFPKITEAITTFPLSLNPIIPTTSTAAAKSIANAPPLNTSPSGALSWYEKILLYDPIVLEDLAAWLNTVGLGRVGVDEEINAGTVKEWCEGRGVCCLWRVNLRGGERARW